MLQHKLSSATGHVGPCEVRGCPDFVFRRRSLVNYSDCGRCIPFHEALSPTFSFPMLCRRCSQLLNIHNQIPVMFLREVGVPFAISVPSQDLGSVQQAIFLIPPVDHEVD
jgi:hypothetical protein